MVMLQNDKNVDLIAILVKGMEIVMGSGDSALLALSVSVIVPPSIAVVIVEGCAPPPSKHSFAASMQRVIEFEHPPK